MSWKKRRNFGPAPGIMVLILALAVAAGVLACISVDGACRLLGGAKAGLSGLFTPDPYALLKASGKSPR